MFGDTRPTKGNPWRTKFTKIKESNSMTFFITNWFLEIKLNIITSASGFCLKLLEIISLYPSTKIWSSSAKTQMSAVDRMSALFLFNPTPFSAKDRYFMR